jgi:hypothetical protein
VNNTFVIDGLDLLKSPFLDPQQSAFYVVSDSGKLLLILWQPASIRDRVLYAASSSLLKDKFPLLYREFHASDEADLEAIKQTVRSGSNAATDRRLAMSVTEIEKEEQVYFLFETLSHCNSPSCS